MAAHVDPPGARTRLPDLTCAGANSDAGGPHAQLRTSASRNGVVRAAKVDSGRCAQERTRVLAAASGGDAREC
jgi:hypothetical protein